MPHRPDNPPESRFMHPCFRALFYEANAARYPEKQDWFYPLKYRLLHRYAHLEGWDLQEIVKVCWRCNGSKEDPEWLGRCDKCNGSGYYRHDFYKLERWNLHGHIYHRPLDIMAASRVEGEPIVRINGYVQHAIISPQRGRRACFLLLCRYEPGKALRWLRRDARRRWQDWVYWGRWRLQVWRQRLNQLGRRRSPEEDDLPF